MKSKLLIVFSAISLIFSLPALTQGQGGGGWGGGGGQGMAGRAGGFNMEDMQRRWIDRAVSETDADDDGELSKAEFLVLLTHENYSYFFAEEDTDSDESDDEKSEADENGDATTNESDDDSEESEEDTLSKFQLALFTAADTDDDGKLTSDELIGSIDFDAAMQRMRERMSERGGGNWQRGGQGGQGGGGWPRGGQGGGRP